MSKKIFSLFFVSLFSLLLAAPIFASESNDDRDSVYHTPSASTVEVYRNDDSSESNTQTGENTSELPEVFSNEVCFDEPDLNLPTPQVSSNSIIEPLKTCWGNGGVVRIEYQSGLMWWSVNPKFSVYYYFKGRMRIVDVDTGKVMRDYTLTAENVAGKTSSDQFNPALNPGNYVATITGWCFDTNGELNIVVPDCDIEFTVK